MTSPTRPIVWLSSIAGTRFLALHDLGKVETEDRLGDLETLTFLHRADDAKAPYIVADFLVQYAGRNYRIAEVRNYRDGPRPLIEVYCEALWLDLGQRSKAGTVSLLAQTALTGLTNILAFTGAAAAGWTAATSPAIVGNFSMEDIDASALTLIRRWAAIVGKEVQFDTVAKTVTFVASIGTNRGAGFRYGNNLRQVERRYKPPRATTLYPFGANNLDITGVNPTALQYVEDYSWYTAQGLTLAQARTLYRRDLITVDTSFLLALNLYDDAVRRLAIYAQPTISYECSVADFATLTATTTDDVTIGDTVRVRDASFSIDIATRVVRIVRDALHPQANQIELAYLQPGLADVADPSTSRSIDYGKLAVLVDQNVATVAVAGSVTPYATIQFTSTGQATIVIGSTVKGTATGTGTVRYALQVNGADTGPTYDFAFTAGQTEFSWPSEVSGLDASSTATITWTMRVTAGTGTISIAAGEGRAWLLSTGAVGVGISNSPNQAIEETLALVVSTLTDTPLVEIINPVDLTPSTTVAQSVYTLTDNTTAPVITIV